MEVKNQSIQARLRQQNWLQLSVQARYCSKHLAALADVSSKTLERFFKKFLRVSPQRWLDYRRQLEAEQLLLAGARTKDASNRLGYAQVSHFCRQFKQTHGMSAKRWRQMATAAFTEGTKRAGRKAQIITTEIPDLSLTDNQLRLSIVRGRLKQSHQEKHSANKPPSNRSASSWVKSPLGKIVERSAPNLKFL